MCQIKKRYVIIGISIDMTILTFKIEDSLPDPDTLEAFICKGNQAVTYGAGE